MTIRSALMQFWMRRFPQKSPLTRRALWFVTGSYDPDGVAAGYLLAELANALDTDFVVRVISRSRTSQTIGRSPNEVERSSDATSFIWRSLKMLYDTASLFFRALIRISHNDVAVVATNPPLLPVALTIASAIRRFRTILLVHDVYPDVFFATGLMRSTSRIGAFMERVFAMPLRRADRIIVIGRDMEQVIINKGTEHQGKVSYIPNWADQRIIDSSGDLTLEPVPYIVQYSGNMGFTHGVEALVECAAILYEEHPTVQFRVHAWGSNLEMFKRLARDLPNILILDPCSRDELPAHLKACHVAVISMIQSMTGISIPSRLYNIMAAGRPIILAADPESEAGRLIAQHQIGWVVPPGNGRAMADAIIESLHDTERRIRMGREARQVARNHYTFTHTLGRYRNVFEDVASQA